MKLYEVTTINIRSNGEYGDEYQTFLGCDFEKALEAKKKALDDYSRLSNRDKKAQAVECRAYEIEDGTDESDTDALIDAISESSGYNLF